MSSHVGSQQKPAVLAAMLLGWTRAVVTIRERPGWNGGPTTWTVPGGNCGVV